MYYVTAALLFVVALAGLLIRNDIFRARWAFVAVTLALLPVLCGWIIGIRFRWQMQYLMYERDLLWDPDRPGKPRTSCPVEEQACTNCKHQENHPDRKHFGVCYAEKISRIREQTDAHLLWRNEPEDCRGWVVRQGISNRCAANPAPPKNAHSENFKPCHRARTIPARMA